MQYEILRRTTCNAIPFTVRIVRQGEWYGYKMGIRHEEEMPLVEFYDARFDNEQFSPGLGQFVSRYKADTLLGHDGFSSRQPGQGIQLEGRHREWQVDGLTLEQVVDWLVDRIACEPQELEVPSLHRGR